VINVVRTEKDLKSLVWVFLLSGFVCALYGCYSYYLNPALLSEDGRVTGTMDDPNEFTGAMVARLPLVLCLLRVEKRRMRRLLLIVGMGMVIFGIVRAESRGGFLALGFALVLFALCQKHRVAWLVIVGVVGLILLGAMPLSLQERLSMLFFEDQNLDSSLLRRMTYQIYGLRLFSKHPILGVGISGFAEAYARSEYRFWQAGSVRRVAHNTYLEILVGTGLIGLAPFMALLALSLFRAWKLANCDQCQPYLASVSAGLFAGMGGYFLSCLFLSQQYEKTLWLLLAMVVVVQQLASDRKHLVSLEDRGRL
jgi:O-antigen ligase